MSKKVNPEEYYKRAHIIDDIIRGSLRDDGKEIVYGARSVNVRMPDYLKKYTEDWDIYSSNAATTAKEMEKTLDKHFGGNYFEVKPAKHEGTFKVISRVTTRNVADITVPEDKIKYESIDGVKYATLDEQVKNIQRSLKDESSSFRHDKDRESLQRIELALKSRGRKPRNEEKVTYQKGKVCIVEKPDNSNHITRKKPVTARNNKGNKKRGEVELGGNIVQSGRRRHIRLW